MVLAVGVPVVLVSALLVARFAGGVDVPDPQMVQLGIACSTAAQDKLQPLITLPSGEVKADRADGTDWTVRTSVDHKTKWVDNWYDVTCVVGADMSVRSVETVPR